MNQQIKLIQKEKIKIDNWTHQKSKLNDWFHYSIEVKTLKNDYENFDLREFEVKIKKQNNDLSMGGFKKIKIITSFSGLLQELIPKLNMYSGYIKLNNSGLYNLDVYNFYNNRSIWREHIQNIYEKYDKKENQYRKESNLK